MNDRRGFREDDPFAEFQKSLDKCEEGHKETREQFAQVMTSQAVMTEKMSNLISTVGEIKETTIANRQDVAVLKIKAQEAEKDSENTYKMLGETRKDLNTLRGASSPVSKAEPLLDKTMIKMLIAGALGLVVITAAAMGMDLTGIVK